MLMPDRQFQQHRQTAVRLRLILTGHADRHMLIAAAPVRRQPDCKPADPLGDDRKVQITAFADHCPCLRTPRVGILQKKIGGHAGKDRLRLVQLIGTVPPPLHRKPETARF